MSGDDFFSVPEGFLRNTLVQQFENIPTCQKLKFSSCDDDEKVLKVKEFQYLSSYYPGRFALTYSIPNQTIPSPNAVGCLGAYGLDSAYYEITDGGENAGFEVPLEETCDDIQVTYETCKKTTITYKVSQSNSLSNSYLIPPSSLIAYS